MSPITIAELASSRVVGYACRKCRMMATGAMFAACIFVGTMNDCLDGIGRRACYEVGAILAVARNRTIDNSRKIGYHPQSMKSEKKQSEGTWFTRDNRGGRYCDLPVATKNPRGHEVGETRPRRALRKRYAALLKAKSTTATGFKAWLRAGV
jgi:hypothetical protein